MTCAIFNLLALLKKKNNMKFPLVYIIILNWNGLQDTLECLESVFKLDYSNFKVVVVDNDSVDDSVTAIRKACLQVTLIKNIKNLGYTGGNNVAMRYAMEHGADYMWLLNNDTVVETNTLRKLVDTAENSSEIGMVSPVIYFFESEKIQFFGSYIDWAVPEILLFTNYSSLEQEQKCKSISLWGTALLIKRSVVEKIGYLEDKYFAYHEDEEYSIRANKAGFRNMVQPQATIYHKNSRSTVSALSPMQTFLRVRNKYFLWMDHLQGIKRVNYLRHYLGYSIGYAGTLKKENLNRSVEACFGGVWAAFHGIGGPWDETIKMPIWLKKIFICFCSWHPYFWVSLLKGDFFYIVSDVYKRTKKNLLK